MLKFYGLGYTEIMKLPMKAFWLMSDSINRVSAVSDMRSLSIMVTAQMGGADVNGAMERLSREVGVVSVEKAEMDINGLNQLKLM